jgi:hypothetical protein
VKEFSVDEKRHDAFASKRGEFHTGKRIDFWGGKAANSGPYS